MPAAATLHLSRPTVTVDGTPLGNVDSVTIDERFDDAPIGRRAVARSLVSITVELNQSTEVHKLIAEQSKVTLHSDGGGRVSLIVNVLGSPESPQFDTKVVDSLD